MNLLQSIISRVTASAEMLAGVTVSYSRGSESAVIEGVLLGHDTEQADTLNPAGQQLEYSDRDFFIRSAGLVLAGEKIEPQSRDEVVILDKDHPDAGKVFEVLSLNGRCFAMADPFVIRYRVFTRQVT